MGEVTKIKVEDRSKIKKVIFNHPDFMADGLEEKVKQNYEAIIALQEQLYQKRDEVRALEKELDKAVKDFEFFKENCTFEFESTTKDYRTQKANILLKGLVYGNKM